MSIAAPTSVSSNLGGAHKYAHVAAVNPSGPAATSFGMQCMMDPRLRYRMRIVTDARTGTTEIVGAMGWITQEWVKMLEQRVQDRNHQQTASSIGTTPNNTTTTTITTESHIARLRRVSESLLAEPNKEATAAFSVREPNTAIPESDLQSIVDRIPNRVAPHGLIEADLDDEGDEEIGDESEVVAAIRAREMEARAAGVDLTVTPSADLLATMRANRRS